MPAGERKKNMSEAGGQQKCGNQGGFHIPEQQQRYPVRQPGRNHSQQNIYKSRDQKELADVGRQIIGKLGDAAPKQEIMAKAEHSEGNQV